MTDLFSFFTQNTGAGSASALSASAKGGGALGLSALITNGGNNADFFNLLLARITNGEEINHQIVKLKPGESFQDEQGQNITLNENEEHLVLKSDDGGLIIFDSEETQALQGHQKALLSLIENQFEKTNTDLKDIQGRDLHDIRLKKLEIKLNRLETIITNLSEGIPKESQPESQAFLEKLQESIETLRVDIQRLRSGEIEISNIPLPLLIAAGLSPSEITRAVAKLEEIEEKIGRELTAEDIIAGVGGFLQKEDVKERVSIVFEQKQTQGNTAQNLENLQNLESSEQPEDGLAGIPLAIQQKINAENKSKQDISIAEILLNPALASKNSAANQNSFENMRKQFGPEYRGNNFNVHTDPGSLDANGISRDINTSVLKEKFQAFMALAKSNNTTTIQSLAPFPLSGGLSGMVYPGDVQIPLGYFENGTLDILQTGLPLSQTSQAAHITLQATQAGQAHPATQLVSATLNKAAKNGGPQNLTIQLDPPDLGKLNIRLEYTKDKTIKAHMIIEKPETYLMLQRDAQTLERSLQNAGIDTDGSDLSFELAQDQSAFDHNNNGKGGGEKNHGKGGGLESAELNEDIIETQVNWMIDPETGYVKYNLIA